MYYTDLLSEKTNPNAKKQQQVSTNPVGKMVDFVMTKNSHKNQSYFTVQLVDYALQ